MTLWPISMFSRTFASVSSAVPATSGGREARADEQRAPGDLEVALGGDDAQDVRAVALAEVGAHRRRRSRRAPGEVRVRVDAGAAGAGDGAARVAGGAMRGLRDFEVRRSRGPRPLGELDEQPDGDAGAALRRVRLAGVVRGAGDVEVRPRAPVDEALEELRRGDRARLAALDGVRDVGVAALDEVGVLVVQRQAPDELAGRARRRRDLGGPGVVVADEARVRRAERDDDRAGERRDVDEPLGAELDRVARGSRRARAGPRRRCC